MIACKDQTLKISCPRETVIEVLNASFGRTDEYICGYSSSANCAYNRSLDVVKLL